MLRPTRRPGVFPFVVQTPSGRMALNPTHLVWKRWSDRDFGGIPKHVRKEHKRLEAHQWLGQR